MRSTLLLAASLALVSACDASSQLQGKWTIKTWTYGTGNADGITEEATVDDAGTLEFLEEPSPTGIGEHTLKRSFTQAPNRGTNEASFTEFATPAEDVVGYDAGGFDSEENQVTIFDGGDTLWNGAWTLDGTTITRQFFTDFGGGASLLEESTLELAR